MTPDRFDEQGEYMCPCYSCPNGTVQMDCKAKRIAAALRSADEAGYRRGKKEAYDMLFAYYQDLIMPGGDIGRSELLARLEMLSGLARSKPSVGEKGEK